MVTALVSTFALVIRGAELVKGEGCAIRINDAFNTFVVEANLITSAISIIDASGFTFT